MIARFAEMAAAWLAGVALMCRGAFAFWRGSADRTDLACLLLGALLLVAVTVAGCRL